MNAADLARLELAKRAYRASEPNAAEVQRGVRKARLGLRRPRQRRAWFSKTLVGVVLAMGGLAFAKPQALSELVSGALEASSLSPKRSGALGGAATPAALTPPRNTPAPHAQAPLAQAPAAPLTAEAPLAVTPGEPAKATSKDAKRSLANGTKPTKLGAQPTAAEPAPQKLASSSGSFPAGSADARSADQPGDVSDWGRVGTALAHGDEPRAMAVLSELSDSDDSRTRDKADLGRAQLMMSNGKRDEACATARSLTNRRAGGRIERQAQVLLKGCR